MRAIVYSQTGGPGVLRLVERSVPATAVGQVRVRLHIFGVNPTDWKSRRGSAPGEATASAGIANFAAGPRSGDVVMTGCLPVQDRV